MTSNRYKSVELPFVCSTLGDWAGEQVKFCIYGMVVLRTMGFPFPMSVEYTRIIVIRAWSWGPLMCSGNVLW